MIKHKASADKLVVEMKRLIDIIQQGEWEDESSLKYATGDLLSALEIFTYANFDESDQEIMFNWAKTGIDKHKKSVTNGGPITER